MNKKTNTKINKEIKKKDTERCKPSYEELENLFKKALADYQNLEKNIDKRMYMRDFQMRKYLVEKFLPVLDGIYMSKKSSKEIKVPDNVKAWFEGIEHILDGINSIFKEIGVEEIEVKKGDTFDPSRHEALASVKEGEGGKVYEVLQPGFEMDGEIIRPARVVVSRNS